MLVTLREPAVRPPTPDGPDPETVFRAARKAGWSEDLAALWAANVAGLPIADEDGKSIPWTMRAVRRHLFGRYLAEHGAFVGDLEGES